MNRYCLLLIIYLFISQFQINDLTASQNGENNHNPQSIPETRLSVEIDGELNEEAWQSALNLELEFEVEPGENVPTNIKTVCMLIYSESYLYAAFKAYDPEIRNLRAFFSDRDAAGSDDWVGLVLDTFNDERRAFDFRVNPLGVQIDGILVDNETDFSYDTIWDSAGKIYDWGYIVEIAIPFNSLRLQRSRDNAQVWGIDAVRSYPRSRSYLFGSFPRDRSNNSYLSQAIKIKGFQGVNSGRNMELMPAVTSFRIDNRPEMPDGSFNKSDFESEFGVSGKWGITPNITLNATLNPDFSQVEADALKLNINEPFALYYPEKRPFFLEGFDYFKPIISDFLVTTQNIFYTRAIREPKAGIKLTGKERGNTFGFYTVVDDKTNLIFPGSQRSVNTSLDDRNVSSVLRYKRDAGNRYTHSVMITNRYGQDYDNSVAGYDADFRITDTDRLQMQVLLSGTKYPEEIADNHEQDKNRFWGNGIDINYRHSTRTWNYWSRFISLDKEFRADLGFIPQVDYRRYRIGSSYLWNAKQSSWFSRMSISSEFDKLEDMQGNNIRTGAYIWGSYSGPLQSSLTAIFGKARERYNNFEFDKFTLDIYSGIKPNGNISLNFNSTLGDGLDYANTRCGSRIMLNPGIDLRISRHFKMECDHTFEQIDIDGSTLYNANISNLSLVYQMDRRTLFRSIVQYVHYDYNVDLYNFDIEPVYKHVHSQFLISYKVNPWTVFFLGYSDNYYGNNEYKISQSDRTFFAKVGYTLK